MKEKIVVWIASTIGAAFLMFLAFGLIRALQVKGIQSSEAAGWVQAIGAIAAIAVAFGIGIHQSTQQKLTAIDLLDETRRRKLATVKAVIDDLFQQCLDVEHEFQDVERDFGNVQFFFSYQKTQFETALSRVDRIPVFELDSSELVKAIIDFQRHARDVKMWIEAGLNAVQGTPDEELWDYNIKQMGALSLQDIRSDYSAAVEVTGGERIREPRPQFHR